ncbi:hypothetical protein [Sulfitobacter guttiformis]|uniref:Uncharacterized protein n=1 Tax=Sulfitobacter guttiformis TaxID=74349 RepID=A0A420DI68_9RHOB|nr:hypothetical protein [Sulfitobacter guttiformis]KIN72321.1 hypothetical protein Z949_1494 [Sulfitobacter guttiformis KCTC 32187]RKE93918.1 hypothetical protein C8N30_3020 [Sulfitobacter guttiformis]
MRAKRWVQNPPSPARVKLVFAVALVAAVIFGLEYFGFWPAWATADRISRRLF